MQFRRVFQSNSCVTSNKAFSVENMGLKPDWDSINKGLSLKYLYSWLSTTHSISLLITGRTDIGQ